jgi:hypothetical protein
MIHRLIWINISSAADEFSKNSSRYQLSTPDDILIWVHILQTNELFFFPEIRRNIQNFKISESCFKTFIVSYPASTQTAKFFLYIFSRKFHNFSEELLSEFHKHPNLSMLFDAATSKAFSCKISTI